MQVRKVSALGKNLFEWRRQRGWTQFDLALESRVTQGMISRVESGTQRDMFCRHVYALALALGVTVEELMRDEE